MQYVRLDLQHQNFFCPATGICLCHEDPDKLGFDNSPMDVLSCQAFWIDEGLTDSMRGGDFKDHTFREAWLNFESKFEEGYWGVDDLINFLKSYPANNWVVYEVTTSGFAYGPVSSTAWWVIDMNSDGQGVSRPME